MLGTRSRILDKTSRICTGWALASNGLKVNGYNCEFLHWCKSELWIWIHFNPNLDTDPDPAF
jgi:hypothetical protein